MANNPTLLTMPIAENGQKNTIPATQAAAGDGLLSQSTGFPPETALPLGAGGKAPTREDFNGAFNLLSDIAFYSQKGWTFQYDENQAYYKGCIVMDATDGRRYECINDVAAGEILPSADTQNEYWREYSPGGVPLGTILPYAANAAETPYSFLFCEGQAISRTMYPDLFALIGTTYGSGDGSTTFNLPNLIEAAMLNGSYTKTSYTTAGSATFTASKTGWYKITAKGGGASGSGGAQTASYYRGGAGGIEGWTTIRYVRLNVGDTVNLVIGAGGAASQPNASGNPGGTTVVTTPSETIVAGGGGGSDSGDIKGVPGGTSVYGVQLNGAGRPGGVGGGAGGGYAFSAGVQGGGGSGGGVSSSNTITGGAAGGDGYATIEYIGISMKYILKAYDAPTPSSAQIDLSQYASDLANKAYRDLQNVTNVAYRRRPRKAFSLADLIAAVQTGNYNQYDICPGDYYVGASGYTYIFAGDNPMKGTYEGYPIKDNHAGLIVDTHETCKWNDTNDTTGGYVSSKLHAYLVNTVLPKVKTDLGGVSHLCAHKKLYSTAITAGLYNRYGNNTGASSSWAWSDNQYIAALSEVQVYGSIVLSSSGYDTGEADQQLEVFRRFKHTEIFGDEYPWLRDVVSSSDAASAYGSGIAANLGASSAYYAAGLICFH